MRELTNTTAEHLPSAEFFIALILFASLCIIVGILGNVGVIVYNIFMNQSKTPTTYFLVNLAVSDILVCVTYFPPWIFEFISVLTEKENTRILICQIRITSSYTSIALSIANLLAITMDRCLFITKPLKYPSIITWKRTYILLAVMWLLAIVNANYIFFNIEKAPEGTLYCIMKNGSFGKILPIFHFYIPFGGIFLLNYKIYNVVKIQRRKIRENCTAQQPVEGTGTAKNATGRREHLQQMKMIKTFAIVLGVLLACLFPRIVISIVNRVCQNFCIPISVKTSVTMLTGANSVMNILVYSARNKEYRVAYRKLISGLFRNN
jgi:hypothetical protein